MTNLPTPEQRSLDRSILTAGQLLVEGRVPEMFFREMITAYGLENKVQARTFGDISRDNLQLYLELFTQKAAFKERVQRLGIGRDAEALSAESAFQAVQSALRGAALYVPGQIEILAGTPLGIAVFILPNCHDPGMLEELCLEAITEVERETPTAVMPCVYDFFACLSQRSLKPSNLAKARFAGYALARDVIDPQLGRAAQKGAIPWEAEAFRRLKEFLFAVAA